MQVLEDDPERAWRDAALDRVRALEERVAGLVRVQDANRERAMREGLPYEAIPFSLLDVLRAVGEPPRPSRAELPARLVQEGLSEAEARRAVAVAERIGLIREGPDRRLWLARPTRGPP